ncbi:MAG: hypothetical protein IT372_35185 [Polyangiaceae bacterium]|nr:hypothetical protein [Polyangiaceae bacterium]
MSPSERDLRAGGASSVRRIGAAAIASVLLGAACTGMSWYDDDCAITSSCPGNNCPGQCVPLPPLGFDGPALLWFGPPEDVPVCPTRAPQPVYLGHADLDTSNECPPCECSEPVCVLPSGAVASSLSCPGGGVTTSYSLASASGECTPLAPAPPDPLGSVSIEPVTVLPCEPVVPPVPAGGKMPSWGTIAKACAGEVVDTVCNDPRLTCVPTAAPPPAGFRQCIAWYHGGEPTCPTDYPDSFTFYGGVDEQRGCSACECTQLFPNQCEAQVLFYEDAACADLLGSMPAFTVPSCHDGMGPGAAIGSIQVTMAPDSEPGSCLPSGGVPTGQVVPVEPTTFCCQPLP